MPSRSADANVVRIDPDLVNLARAYLAKRAAEIDIIDASMERRDFETIQRIGHNMQGSGEMFGFGELSGVGAEMQRAVEAGDVPGILRARHRMARFLARTEVDGARAEQEQHQSTSMDGEAAPHSVLLVDDDEMNRILITHYLEREGYAVTQAASGEEALRMLEDGPLPRLILLDVVMPGTSGLEVCRRIKRNVSTGAIPIVLLTALGKTEDRVRGMEAGADDFVTKPVSRADLLARVALFSPGASSTKGPASDRAASCSRRIRPSYRR